MNNQFDELAKNLAQSVTRRAALKKFGIGLAGMALVWFGLTHKAGARTTNCLPAGNRCHEGNQCCSGLCSNRYCACLPNGSQCQGNTQCCTGVCSNGYCACLPAGSPCGGGRMCCGGLTCLFGYCRQLRFP